jgi:hypothetical protein
MDAYAHWRECLRTGAQAGTDDPACGFWRHRRGKGGPYQPVALFERDGEVVCVAGAQYAPVHRVWRVWFEPISEAAYRAAVVAGHFPDELPTGDPAKPYTTDLNAAAIVLPPHLRG